MQSTRAFTLVELILVMALLATVMALSAPALSRSSRQRHLDQEALRLLAVIEGARDEAVSQGVPMVVWLDATAGRYGFRPKAGFSGADVKEREYAVNRDVQFEGMLIVGEGGTHQLAEFAPTGSPAVASMESLRLVDRFQSVVTIARTPDAWSYEIVKEER